MTFQAKHRIRRPHARVTTVWNPVTLWAAYGLPRLTFPAGGKDTVIGIGQLGGGYKLSDITAAFAEWKLPAPNITVVPLGASNSPGDDADAEVDLDMQYAAGLYSAGWVTPRAAVIRVYFAPNTEDGFASVYDAARKDGCDVLSWSWGGPEDQWSAAGAAAMAAAAKAARAAGMTLPAASGDNDSGDGNPAPTTDLPACLPDSLGCGGTTKPATGVEGVWNDGQNGTGGGASKLYTRPAYQTGEPSNLPAGRIVPDVASVADPQTGVQIFINGGTEVIGGTSAAAPTWAGIVAACKAANPAMPDVLTTVYANATLLKDITSGNNGAYQAGPGPDACTGCGAPAAGIVSLLAGIGTTTPPPTNPPPTNPPTNPPPTQPPPVTPVPPSGNFNLQLSALCGPNHAVLGATYTITAVKTSVHVGSMVAAFNLADPSFTLPPALAALLAKEEMIVADVLMVDVPLVFVGLETWAEVLTDVENAVAAGLFRNG